MDTEKEQPKSEQSLVCPFDPAEANVCDACQ